MRLYTFYRSLAAWRVRIALHLKGLDVEQVPIDLLAGEQHAVGYKAVNPESAVPLLEIDGEALAQSLAILEYLEETRPEPLLLPADPAQRALARRLALIGTADAHPLIVPRVRSYLAQELGQDEDGIARWARHWLGRGCAAMEALAEARGLGGNGFFFGDAPGYAEAVLVPQMFGLKTFGGDPGAYPILSRIEAACLEREAFAATHPRHAPDFPAEG